MFKALVIAFSLIALSCGQYLRQQHPPAAAWGRSGALNQAGSWGRSYGGNVGYRGWTQPANVGYGGSYRTQISHGGYGGAPVAPVAGPISYGGAYRAPVAPVAGPIAYGGGYGGAYGGAYRGAGYTSAYAAPVGVARVSQPVAPVAVARPQYYGGRYAEDESYKPYTFGFNTVDEYGTQLGRQETADGNGNVRGSYSYRDPNGQFRQVEYVADGAGFRAEVNTNEAGVVSHRPADAVYNVHNK